MANKRAYLLRANVSELATLAGCAEKTARTRLDKAGIEPLEHRGRSRIFATPPALRAILAPETFDPQQEKARLDRVRREIEEEKLAKIRGELIPIEWFKSALAGVASLVRSRMMNLPDRTSMQVFEKAREPDANPAVVREIILDDCRATLTEISEAVGRESSRIADEAAGSTQSQKRSEQHGI